jgi:2-aminoethylphosphonate-pyruvate transaminase|tara:strand:+ start:1089 stop:1271 length:183 start_codon:yes stop_codon:yes gene_type:complete
LLFAPFFDALHQRGFVIYPREITTAETFRIGCIGASTPANIDAAIAAEVTALGKIGASAP